MLVFGIVANWHQLGVYLLYSSKITLVPTELPRCVPIWSFGNGKDIGKKHKKTLMRIYLEIWWRSGWETGEPQQIWYPKVQSCGIFWYPKLKKIIPNCESCIVFGSGRQAVFLFKFRLKCSYWTFVAKSWADPEKLEKHVCYCLFYSCLFLYLNLGGMPSVNYPLGQGQLSSPWIGQYIHTRTDFTNWDILCIGSTKGRATFTCIPSRSFNIAP